MNAEQTRPQSPQGGIFGGSIDIIAGLERWLAAEKEAAGSHDTPPQFHPPQKDNCASIDQLKKKLARETKAKMSLLAQFDAARRVMDEQRTIIQLSRDAARAANLQQEHVCVLAKHQRMQLQLKGTEEKYQRLKKNAAKLRGVVREKEEAHANALAESQKIRLQNVAKLRSLVTQRDEACTRFYELNKTTSKLRDLVMKKDGVILKLERKVQKLEEDLEAIQETLRGLKVKCEKYRKRAYRLKAQSKQKSVDEGEVIQALLYTLQKKGISRESYKALTEVLADIPKEWR